MTCMGSARGLLPPLVITGVGTLPKFRHSLPWASQGRGIDPPPKLQVGWGAKTLITNIYAKFARKILAPCGRGLCNFFQTYCPSLDNIATLRVGEKNCARFACTKLQLSVFAFPPKIPCTCLCGRRVHHVAYKVMCIFFH